MTSSKPIDKDPPQQISQPHIPLTKPLLPPLTALIPLLEEIWRNGWVTNNGPLQRRLEATLTSQFGWQNVVSTANGTLALQLACRALGLEGEVITPSFTFPATVQALIWNNLIPVFGDIEPEHLTLNPDAVTSLISPRTSCILRPPEVRRVVELKQSMIVKVGTRRQPLYVVRRREEGPTCELICE